MLTALLSDIHANLEALNACLHHARSRGAERFAFLGDLVGYGADARAVVEVVCRYAAQGAVVLKGNHDQAIDRSAGYFNDASQRGAGVGTRHAQRGAEALSRRAAARRARGEVCYVHASAATPERWDYIDSPAAAKRCAEATDARYTFCGHVHDQVLYFEGAQGRMSEFRPFPGTAIPARSHRRWVGIVGSVGQPRDRNPAAAYALFDLDRQEVTFFRVPYDAAAAAEKIRACGLPASLAYRVELGI